MTAWPLVPLGEVLEQYKKYIDAPEARPYPKLSVKLYGKGVRLDSPADGTSLKMQRHQIATAGQVILSEIWGKKGAIGFVPVEGDGALCTSHFFLFDVHTDRLDPRWLRAIFTANYLESQLDSEAKGTTGYAAVRPAHLLKAQIPLPPLEEQRRMLSRIEALSKRVNDARSLHDDTSKAVAALIGSIAGEAMADAIRRHGQRPLGTFEPVVTSGPRNWAEKCGQGAIRFYRAQDLGPDGRISHKSKAFIPPPENGQAKAAKLVPGDVMLVITGATVGRCAVFSASDEPGYVNQHVALCRLPQTNVEPNFVRWALLSPQGQEQLLGKRYGQGKPGLNLNNIRQLTIPAAPLSEQQRVAERLDSTSQQMDRLRSAQGTVSEEIESLVPSVLNHAFSGKL